MKKLLKFCIAAIIAFVLVTLLFSCSTSKNVCPTYGYKRVFVNGKKFYFIPAYGVNPSKRIPPNGHSKLRMNANRLF